MYYISEINNHNKSKFEMFNDAMYSYEFNMIGTSNRTCAVGASIFGEPIAFTLAYLIKPEENTWEISYIYVIPSYRNMGIAKSMLNKVEEIIQGKGAFKINFNYSRENSNFIYIQKLLTGLNFNAYADEMYFLKHDCSELQKTKWLNKEFLQSFTKRSSVVSNEYQVFTWNYLREHERKYLITENGISYPSYLSPLVEEDRICKNVSVGLRHNDNLVGWIIANKVHDFMYVRSAFLQKKYRGKIFFSYMFATLLELAKKEEINYITASVKLDNHVMLKNFDRLSNEALISKNQKLCWSKFI